MTDIDALKECINQSGMTITFIADKAGMLRETFYNRLKYGDFKASEVYSLSKILGLSVEQRDKIFFADKGE